MGVEISSAVDSMRDFFAGRGGEEYCSGVDGGVGMADYNRNKRNDQFDREHGEWGDACGPEG